MVYASHNMALCSQCYDCIKSCPGQALSVVEGVMYHSKNNCTLCENCTDVCDSNAIEVKI
ncbi:MAG: 4Fe-4S binding protein [Methanobrevibacter sp.]|nr:4Fe-4S binding protein [Methanobrevibacter sp.]